MADEPRRSGRATKGQYTKDRDIDEDGPKKKGKAKGSKTKEPEVQNEDEENIRCICGHYEEEEDTQRDMICCDSCSAWQHNDCMLLPYPPEDAPDKYFCEQCKPGDHEELLAAMKRGEKPWEEVAKKREAAEAEKAAKKKKGGKKKGRKPGSRPSEAASEASPDVDTQTPNEVIGSSSAGLKRKHEEPSNGAATPQETKKQRQTSAHPTPSSIETQNGGHTLPQKRKPSVNTPSRQNSRPDASHGLAVSSADELSTQRRSVAVSLIKQFSADAAAAQKQGKFSTPAGETANDIGTRLGLSVEHALYHVLCHGSGDPNVAYRDQLRTILFNVKKNEALRDGLLDGSIGGEDLARMNSEDMASEEQQLRDAKLKQEQEKQHVIIQEQGPRIRRTHKGDEYVDETQQIAAEPEAVNAPVRRRESMLDQEMGEMRSPSAASPSSRMSPDGKPLSINTQARARPSTEPERKSSQAFNIQDVWSSVQGSPDGQGPSFPQIPYQSGAQPEQANQTEADPDIDALLKDEEIESPPYSPKSFDGDNTVIWRGTINMSPIARFQCSARKAAGAEVENLGLTWPQLIPDILTIEGRIDPSRADSYLCGLRYSSTSDVIVVALRAAETATDRHHFSVLFNYFKTRNRYGVGVNPSNAAIKDIYLIPLEAGSEKKPELLQLLDNDNIETPIAEDMLLVPFVVKTSELAANANAAPREQPQQPQQPVGASPITGVGPGLPASTSTAYPTPTPPPFPPFSTVSTVSTAAAPTAPQLPQPQPQATEYTPASPSASVQQQQLPQQLQQQQQQQQQPPPPPTGHQAALYILGPHASQLPAVQELLVQAPEAGVLEMNVVRDCLAENPEAGADLDVLTRMLVKRDARGHG